jgi:hypothetical protein
MNIMAYCVKTKSNSVVIQQQMDRLPHTENSVTIDDPFARVLLAGLLGLAPPPTIGHVIDNNKADKE